MKSHTFRPFAEHSELGAAWRQRTNSEPPQAHLSAELDGPLLVESTG
jgi:uncharacterized protein (DUF736 family)